MAKRKTKKINSVTRIKKYKTKSGANVPGHYRYYHSKNPKGSTWSIEQEKHRRERGERLKKARK